jgi:hypothetical protein
MSSCKKEDKDMEKVVKKLKDLLCNILSSSQTPPPPRPQRTNLNTATIIMGWWHIAPQIMTPFLLQEDLRRVQK